MPDLIDYAELAAAAEESIEGTGRAVTFVKLNRTPADSDKPWDGPTDPRVGATSLAGFATFVEPSSATALGLSTQFLEQLIKRKASIMLVAPGTTVTADLAEYDEVIDSPNRWRIFHVETLRPGNVTLLYFLGVEK